jgi:hypothetical protein
LRRSSQSLCCFRPAGDRFGGALQLADHCAELDFQKLQDFPGRIALRRSNGLGDGLGRLRRDRGRELLRQTLLK